MSWRYWATISSPHIYLNLCGSLSEAKYQEPAIVTMVTTLKIKSGIFQMISTFKMQTPTH